jgi:hypothetical protein
VKNSNRKGIVYPKKDLERYDPRPKLDKFHLDLDHHKEIENPNSLYPESHENCENKEHLSKELVPSRES